MKPRDVFGLSPADTAKIAQQAATWWKNNKARWVGPRPLTTTQELSDAMDASSRVYHTGGAALDKRLTGGVKWRQFRGPQTSGLWGPGGTTPVPPPPPRPPAAPRAPWLAPVAPPKVAPSQRPDESRKSKPAKPPKPAAYRAHERVLDQQVEAYCQRYAPDHGLAPEQYRRRARAALQAAVDTLDPRTRVKHDALVEILESGRWRSQFETGKSSGFLGPDVRRECEESVLGLPRDLPAAKRPIYGYLAAPATPSDAPAEQEVRVQYGHVLVRLKPAVRAKTTFTVGDSLDHRDQVQAAPARRANLRAFPPHRHGFDLLDMGAPGADLALDLTEWYIYVESQYTSLKLSDIAEIILESPPPPEPGLIAAIEKRGIPWRIVMLP